MKLMDYFKRGPERRRMLTQSAKWLDSKRPFNMPQFFPRPWQDRSGYLPGNDRNSAGQRRQARRAA
jgi:hypothetical protein